MFSQYYAGILTLIPYSALFRSFMYVSVTSLVCERRKSEGRKKLTEGKEGAFWLFYQNDIGH